MMSGFPMRVPGLCSIPQLVWDEIVWTYRAGDHEMAFKKYAEACKAFTPKPPPPLPGNVAPGQRLAPPEHHDGAAY